MPFRAPIARPAFAAAAARDRERNRRAAGLRRLYDTAQWRKRTQPAVLRRDPFCKIGKLCGGRALSTDVDHIIKASDYVAQHGGDERYFFDLNNLQGACREDHTAKTARGG
jgi:5-methylcytosine-specific restriction endonuclease McrA